MGQVADYLRSEVYPRLDAVQQGFLDGLNPKIKPGKRVYYTLDCPSCHSKQRAFYYPGNAFIVCNRRNECKEPNTNLYNYIQDSQNLNNAETVRLLCDKAGVKMPSTGGQPSREQIIQHTQQHSLKESLLPLLRGYLKNHEAAKQYLHERGYTPADIEQMPVGYYPSWQTLERDLKNAGADIALAMKWNLIPDSATRKTLNKHKQWLFDGRIVGVWPGAEGLSLWGRKITEEAPGPKYYFSSGTDKTQPYGWSSGAISFPWCVEGMLDAEALNLMGVNGLGVGGNSINYAQAAFFAERGVSQLGFVTDADKAGIDGGRQTVERCEPLGITTYIAVVPKGLDDVDKMRQLGKTHEFHHLIQNPVLGGTYIARLALAKLHLQPAEAGNVMQKALRIYDTLTPTSQLGFAHTLLQYGYPLPDFSAQAKALEARLIEAGLSEELAESRSLAAYGLSKSDEATPSNPQQVKHG